MRNREKDREKISAKKTENLQKQRERQRNTKGTIKRSHRNTGYAKECLCVRERERQR